jgi:hypothetical protein
MCGVLRPRRSKPMLPWHMALYVSICIYIYLSVYLPTYLFVYLYICLSACLSSSITDEVDIVVTLWTFILETFGSNLGWVPTILAGF